MSAHWGSTAMMALVVATSCLVVATRDHLDQPGRPADPPTSAAAFPAGQGGRRRPSPDPRR